VISVDLPLVAQLAPGDRVMFEEISLWQARGMYLRNEYLIRHLLR
jgi:allophanate hydrolase subunit 2